MSEGYYEENVDANSQDMVDRVLEKCMPEPIDTDAKIKQIIGL